MAKKKKYSPKFKFDVVIEALTGDRCDSEVARAHGIHPVTLCKWKQEVLDKGPEIFSKDQTTRGYERRIVHLERVLGQKEVEIALLKNFAGNS
jgi:transposase-like protein